MPLTEKQKQYYLKRQGAHCPYCRCDMPAPECFEPPIMKFEGDKTKIGRQMECLCCGMKWMEIYWIIRLYGVRGLDEIKLV